MRNRCLETYDFGDYLSELLPTRDLEPSFDLIAISLVIQKAIGETSQPLRDP